MISSTGSAERSCACGPTLGRSRSGRTPLPAAPPPSARAQSDTGSHIPAARRDQDTGYPVTVIGSLLEVWPDAVTVIEAVPGLIGNDPVAGGRSKVIDVSLQLVIVTLAPS